MKRRSVLIALVLVAAFAGVAAAAYWLGLSQAKPTEKAKKSTVKQETKTSSDKEETPSSDTGQKTTVSLYFSDSQAQYLVLENREIDKTDNIAKVAVEELVKGPNTAGNAATVPDSMIVQSVTVSDGLARVDFGQAFNALVPSGSAGETMFFYSIVNTLTSIEGITKVRFMAGGQTPVVQNSRIDFSAAFTRNDSLIKK